MTDSSEVQRRLIPASKWHQHHVWPTVSALRYYIFNAQKFGLKHAIVRVGRRVLIDELAFFQWVESVGGRNDSH